MPDHTSYKSYGHGKLLICIGQWQKQRINRLNVMSCHILVLTRLCIIWNYMCHGLSRIIIRKLTILTILHMYAHNSNLILLQNVLLTGVGSHLCQGMSVLLLTAHNWQNWKSIFLTCSCHEIYWVEAVGLKNSNYTIKQYDFCVYVKFGAISWKKLYFVNNCLIKVQI